MQYLAATIDERLFTPCSLLVSCSMQMHRERDFPVINSSLAPHFNCSKDASSCVVEIF